MRNSNEFKDPEPDNPKLNINIPPKPSVFQKKAIVYIIIRHSKIIKLKQKKNQMLKIQ